MKYIISLLLILFFVVSCGPSGQERTERATSDSIATIESQKEQVKDTITMSPVTVQPKIMMLVMSDSMIAEKQSEKIGEITHLIKDTMNYGVADTVELTVSYNMPTSAVIQQVGTFSHASPSNITTQSVRLTPYMRARLIDPTKKNFIIVPITDSIQYVETQDNTFTLWQWRVTPLKGGSKELVLNVDMIVGEHSKSLKIYQDNIYVYISPMTTFWNWVKTNWMYITGAFGLIVTLLTLREKIMSLFKKKD
jgi:hypothetical protein